MNKILFLDIDGVLNKDSTKEKIKTPPYVDFQGLDPELRDRFLEWYGQYKNRNLNVVLSSTWRLHESLLEELDREGLVWIDETPKLATSDRPRGNEVKKWLTETTLNVESYAILDDIKEWFLPEQMERLVHTDYKKGLTKAKLAELDELLQSESIL
jgi:hypothetical protein